MNCIFRALHTIKGTSSFLGFDPIVQLGHRAEDVLNALRRHDLPVTRSLMDALLAARDQLGKMLVDLRAGGLKQKYPIEKLIADLEKVQKGETTSTTAVESRPEESVPAPGAETIRSVRIARTCAAAAAKDFSRRRSDHAGGCSQA
jgi:two-component system chemotaxis sensor kinase CheA